MNPNYSLASTYNGLSGGKEETIRYFKGKTEISIDLSDATEGFYPIIKILVDFNDKTPNLIKEYSFDDSRRIVREPIKHTYYPDSNFDQIMYYTTVYIIYSNFNQFAYQLPIKISKESFYSEYSNLIVADTQFIDNSENSTFLILDTANGDNLNLVIK